MEEIQVVQGSPEWLALRKDLIGSSDCAGIMGVSKFGDTPYKIWARKLGLIPEKERNEAMNYGIINEPIARQAFIKETGILVVPKTFIANEFQIASFDGVDFDNKYAVELKCPKEITDHQMALDGVVPPHYLYQLYHQMMVLGLSMMFYFSYREDSQKVIEVPFNKEEADKLFNAEVEFYKCLKNMEAPTLTERDYVTRTDTEWTQKAGLLKTIIEERKELKQKEEMLKKELIELSGDTNTSGAGIRLSKIIKKGNLKYKEIPELQNVNLDLHRGPNVIYWRVL